MLEFVTGSWPLVGLFVGMGASAAWVAAVIYALHVF